MCRKKLLCLSKYECLGRGIIALELFGTHRESNSSFNDRVIASNKVRRPLKFWVSYLHKILSK